MGGDAQVALVSRGTPLPKDAPFRRGTIVSQRASSATVELFKGREAPSLSTVTATMQELLAQVQDERVIPNVAASKDA